MATENLIDEPRHSEANSAPVTVALSEPKDHDSEWDVQITPAASSDVARKLSFAPAMRSMDARQSSPTRRFLEVPESTVHDVSFGTASSRANNAIEIDQRSPSETQDASFRKQATVPGPVRYAVVIVGILIGAGLIRIVILYVLIQFHLRSCSAAVGEVQAAVDAIQKDRGIRKQIVVVDSPTVVEPSACGVFRWRIVLPCRLETQLSTQELNALLCHEIGHLIRRDTVWLWFSRLLRNCLCWQPLNLLAIKRWQEASEFLCDDWAVESAQSRVVLARVLTTIAEQISRRTFSPGVPIAAPPLSLRVERLLNDHWMPDRWLTHRRRFALGAVMLASLGAVVCFAPRLLLAETTSDASDATTEESFVNESSVSNSNENVHREQLRSDLAALIVDLEFAIELLNQQESNEDVRQKTALILQRLDQLRDKVE